MEESNHAMQYFTDCKNLLRGCLLQDFPGLFLFLSLLGRMPKMSLMGLESHKCDSNP